MSMNIDQITTSAGTILLTDKLYLGRAPFGVGDDRYLLGSVLLNPALISQTFTSNAVAGLRLNNLTQAEVNALTPSAGHIWFNTTAAIAQYYDGTITQNIANQTDLAGYLLLAGGTMIGDLILNGNPTTALGAVPKQYVDTFAQGIIYETAVYAGTTANLDASYNNGVSGVDATLTNTGVFAAFSIDGVSPPLNARILVKNQNSTLENGAYTLQIVGSGAVPWILKRATDFDQPTEVALGAAFYVQNGSAQATNTWVQNSSGPFVIGTSPITFAQSGGTSGTVVDVSVVPANGVSGSVANSTTTPAITLTLGDITPTSIVASGTISGSNLSGTNTGTQTITLTSDVTGSGTGSFATTIADNAVTYVKLQNASAGNVILANPTGGALDYSELAVGVSELVGGSDAGALTTITLGTNLTMSGSTLNATGGGSSFTWNTVSGATQNAAVSNGYFTNNAGAVTVTLPDTFAVGDTIRVFGQGAGGWIVDYGTGINCIIGNLTTTTTTGTILSTNQYDGITLTGMVANTTWYVSIDVGQPGKT